MILEVTDSENGSTVMERYELEFDKVDNITRETILNNYQVDGSLQGEEVREYSYDALDQLTSVLVTRGEETVSQADYTYDLAGNRLTETKDGEETNYTYNSLNQLTASAKATVVEEGETPEILENKTYTYDANGAQTLVSDSITLESQESVFDAAGRLASYVEKENGVTTLTQENEYNGADQRIKKTETAGTNPADIVEYFYQDGQVLYTKGSDANHAFNILGAGDNIIATEHQDTAGNPSYYFYTKDLRGSTTNILDASMTSQVSYNYDWFGNTEVYEPENTDFYNQICYTGGVYDESTQLYYLNARYYNPADGRFLSQDSYRGSIVDANSWNLYTYCANNPVKYSDPSGHFIWFAIGAAMAVYDGYHAYKKAKKKGKSGWGIAAAVAKSAVKSFAFGKVTKAFKAVKAVAKITKKVYKSKIVKKVIKKVKKKATKWKPKKKTISKSSKGKKKPPSVKKATVKNTSAAKKASSSKGGTDGKYLVGAYQDIKGVPGLDAHHVGQKSLMKDLVENYDPKTAPAINVPKVGHTISGPNGIVSRSTNGIDSARQLLARDIMELRRVYDDIPNSALKELIELNKKMYPEMRVK